MKKLILTILILTILISISSALIPFTTIEKGDTYIKWAWAINDTKNLSIDGYNVCNFDTASTSFILTGLYQNETHSIRIVNNTDYGENTATTTKSSESSLIDMVLYYKWFIIAMILLLISIGIDSPIVGLFGTAIMGISFVMYLVINVLSIEVLIYALGLMFSVIIGIARWH